ncbi:hypothetical protein Fcan01_20881 [Folsomia candida]|uniref:Uncharacterized protein n=1 Tax=Folsomia candida TaxID=158441 RepID=A0A226DHX2_FOLCA|nr:hypothetical protein Fcan01_20881 [Folsomia candida]
MSIKGIQIGSCASLITKLLTKYHTDPEILQKFISNMTSNRTIAVFTLILVISFCLVFVTTYEPCTDNYEESCSKACGEGRDAIKKCCRTYGHSTGHCIGTGSDGAGDAYCC